MEGKKRKGKERRAKKERRQLTFWQAAKALERIRSWLAGRRGRHEVHVTMWWC
jgi:hypothetical protein